MSSSSFINLAAIPSYTSAAGSNLSFIAVNNNTTTTRVNWNILTSGLVKSKTEEPLGTGSSGTYGDMVVSYSGVYTYNDGWGKSPRYSDNWDDLTAQTRFMLVNDEMSLTSQEKVNVLESLGINDATQAPGIVQVSEDSDDESCVPTWEAIKTYITTEIAKSGTDLADYKGPVHIQNSDGDTILKYSEEDGITKVELGAGVDVVYISPTTATYFTVDGDTVGKLESE